ncbi:MAG: hypothetical protein K6T28_00170 [Acidothermus sp.]|nr:hypothetical protein [Acidothermus sp.]
MTETDRQELEQRPAKLAVQVDASESYKTGAFRLAQRIENSPAYLTYLETGSVAATKGDELFRALRLPPTTDARRIASALDARTKELRRIDKGEVVEYLLKVAELRNPEVLPFVSEEEAIAAVLSSRSSGKENRR